MKPSLVVCVRERVAHVPKSKLVLGKCGHKVWVSPSGQKVLNAEYICRECFLILVHGRSDAEVYIAPGAFAEIAEEFGVSYADQLQAKMRDLGLVEGGVDGPTEVP